MKRIALSAFAAAAAFSSLAWSPAANACGGFFCNNTPIDQSGEEIVFDVTPGNVEAHVKIQYTGAAQDFAWVVPVHGVPTLKIGAPQFFTYLRDATAPRFNVTWDYGSCGYFTGGGGAGGGFADAGSVYPGPQDKGVTVFAQGQVGPYDSAVLGADSAQHLSDWLTQNGYNLKDASVLEPYIGQGYNFLALKLQQDRSVGELRPIVIQFGGDVPCIPIRLTAVAAQPDMPITGYVFANARAVPTNYRHVLLNETRIAWASYGSNYTQAASRAVDEAGGRAFLTEYAGSSTPLQSPATYLLPGPDLDTAALAQLTDPVDFTQALEQQNFPRGDGAIFAMFLKYIPLPKALEGTVTPQQFYNQIAQYRSDIQNDPGRMPFDAAGFANELQTVIVEPLLHAREVMSKHPYFTRLFTTMSAEEMTVDPEFDFNVSAPDVSRDHNAKLKMLCESDGSNRRYDVTLSDGTEYVTSENDQGQLFDGPYAEVVEQYSATGAPGTVADNRSQIASLVSKFKGTDSGNATANSGLPVFGGGSGCTAVPGDALAALASIAAAFALRRGARRKRS